MRLLLEQALGHAIHALGELVQLARFVWGDPSTQVAGGDGLGRGRRVAQWAHEQRWIWYAPKAVKTITSAATSALIVSAPRAGFAWS
jgi:hypothetical protein